MIQPLQEPRPSGRPWALAATGIRDDRYHKVFTGNIGNGLTARFREVKPGAVVLALLCAAYFVFGLPY